MTLGAIFALSRPLEMSLFPFAVILQVTPIVAIAPLILIYVNNDLRGAADLRLDRRVLSDPVGHRDRACARPITTCATSSRSTAPRPGSGCGYLLAPSALPFFMAALKVAGGLALIGAVVAEFVAGTTGRNTGLASRIIECSFRNEIPRMFAALRSGLAARDRHLRADLLGLAAACSATGTRARSGVKPERWPRRLARRRGRSIVTIAGGRIAADHSRSGPGAGG